ncbi:MAG: nucleotidyltransferase domain-containing protein [Methanobrevibacter sp.]|jgi:predicted nucleotidyltransferase|nr:nucleotidyltransferase domain-containing protein [Methanobrevibacter sp.]
MNRKEIAIDFAKSLNHEDIEKIILYGSVARGDDNEDSDIDVLVLTRDIDKVEEDIHSKANKILLKTWESISVKIISADHYNKFRTIPFFKNIDREGILIG